MAFEVTEVKQNAVSIQEDFKAIAGDYLASMGSNLNENERSQFVNMCVSFGLNPFKHEIYGIGYNGKDGRSFNIIVGYEVYLKRAERSGKLDGYEVKIEGSGDNLKAVCTIFRKDWTRPFVHEVYLSEYSTGKSLWASKPKTMLKKVAMAQGFRLCFPDELGGMPYTSDELGEKETKIEILTEKPVEKVVIGEKPKKFFSTEQVSAEEAFN